MHAGGNHVTLLGTATGTALTLLVNIPTQQIWNTIVLTAIGASVSFLVSLALKWLTAHIRRRN